MWTTSILDRDGRDLTLHGGRAGRAGRAGWVLVQRTQLAHAHFESVYQKSKIAGTSRVIPKNQGTTVSGFAPFTVISVHSVAISSLSARYHEAKDVTHCLHVHTSNCSQ